MMHQASLIELSLILKISVKVHMGANHL